MADTDRGERRLGTAPRWLIGLLVLSLAGNLAVVGIAGGKMFRQNSEQGLDWVERSIVRILPEERRPEARMILRGDPETARAQLEAMVPASERVIAAAMADPFDPEALRAALAANGEVHALRAATRRDEIVELMTVLSRSERAIIAEAFERRLRRRQERHAR